MTEYFDKKSTEWDQQKYRVERAKQVASSIASKIPLSSGITAMDFGCGTGLLGFNLVGCVGHMTFGDTSQGMLDQVTKKIQDNKCQNATTLLLEAGSALPKFDLIMSLMVLHHIEDTQSVVSVLSDSVKNGGYICLCDLDKEDGSFHQEEIVPHNGFERKYIESILLMKQIQILDTSTVFVNKKEIKGVTYNFPVFMIVGKKVV